MWFCVCLCFFVLTLIWKTKVMRQTKQKQTPKTARALRRRFSAFSFSRFFFFSFFFSHFNWRIFGFLISREMSVSPRFGTFHVSAVSLRRLQFLFPRLASFLFLYLSLSLSLSLSSAPMKFGKKETHQWSRYSFTLHQFWNGCVSMKFRE